MIELSFVTQAGPGSRLIRWFTHSDYSHVDIIIDGYRWGARFDYPVNGKTGVQVRLPNYAVFTRDDRLRIPVPPAQLAIAEDWLCQQLDKPYDRDGLFASFVFGRADWRNDGKWWCSELGMAFLEHAGIPRCRIHQNRIAPNDLYIYASAFALEP
jgi:hypothetical protein